MKFEKITDLKIKELVFASIFGIFILGTPLIWQIQNNFIQNKNIYEWDLLAFYKAQGYFVATSVLGLVSLLLSSFYDKYQVGNRNIGTQTAGTHQKRNQTILFRVLLSIRIVLVIFTIIYWIQLINLQWFSKIDHVFEIGFPYSLYPFLLIINFFVLFVFLIFEPWLFLTKLLSAWFGFKYKFLGAFELINNFIIQKETSKSALS